MSTSNFEQICDFILWILQLTFSGKPKCTVCYHDWETSVQSFDCIKMFVFKFVVFI